MLLHEFVCFVFCVTSFPFVIFHGVRVFSHIVSHYLYLCVKCFVSHRSFMSFLRGVDVYHTRTQNASIIFTLLLLLCGVEVYQTRTQNASIFTLLVMQTSLRNNS